MEEYVGKYIEGVVGCFVFVGSGGIVGGVICGDEFGNLFV